MILMILFSYFPFHPMRKPLVADRLKWPAWKKHAILVIVSVYSFLGNCSLVGPSVYISIYAEEFGISHADASGLISYPNLAFGFGVFLGS
jgi:hypothetical protein